MADPALPALAPPPTPVLAPPSALAIETSLLRGAVLSLKSGAPADALVDLDGYFARFSRGVLRREARIARVDALLALGNDADALEDLERLTLSRHGRDQELQILRGELRARHRCAAAITDFTAVLAGSPPAALAERALWGRAACRMREGEHAGAAADLTAYTRRFPRGRHAKEARALLDGARP